MKKLLILDVDGTLVEPFDGAEFLPGVLDRLKHLKATSDRIGVQLLVALATNQGGVGYRETLESSPDPKARGLAENYPDAGDVYERLEKVLDPIQVIFGDNVTALVSYAYQGNHVWNPSARNDDEAVKNQLYWFSWSKSWRKPGAGMIKFAMSQASVSAQDVVMVGDSQSDEEAALAAGVAFRSAKVFFPSSASDMNVVGQEIWRHVPFLDNPNRILDAESSQLCQIVEYDPLTQITIAQVPDVGLVRFNSSGIDVKGLDYGWYSVRDEMPI